MILIGIGGYKGSGKDYVADYLVREHGFIKISFADPLKEILEKLLGFTHDQLYDPALKEVVDEHVGMSPRQAMQWMGTEAVRDAFGLAARAAGVPRYMADPGCTWAYATMLRVQSLAALDPYVRIVIPDVRFENEWAACAAVGHTLLVVSESEDYDMARDTHASEQGAASLKWHSKIVNVRGALPTDLNNLVDQLTSEEFEDKEHG